MAAQTQQTSASPSTTVSQECRNNIQKDLDNKDATVDHFKARLLAESSSQFKSAVQDQNANFSSIFYEGSFDPNSCTATITTVAVSYNTISNNHFKNIIVMLDPSLTKVQNVTIVLDPPSNIVNHNSGPGITWSGYSFQGSGSQYTVPVYQASATWNIPYIAQAYSGQCATSYCGISVWADLSDTDSTSNLAQGGSMSYMTCPIGCYPYYILWYEFYPVQSSSQECTGTNIQPGDSVSSTVTNRAKPGVGGDVYHYDITVYDNTNYVFCGTSNYYFSGAGTPYIGRYEAETPQGCRVIGGGCYTMGLPYFSPTLSINANMYYSGATYGIATPFTNGWGYADELWTSNGLQQMAYLDNVDQYSTFTNKFVDPSVLHIIAVTCNPQLSPLTGMAVSLYNSNNQLVQSGYTPMDVSNLASGSYTIDFSNYNGNNFSYAPIVSPVTSSTAYSWGGQVQISTTSGSGYTVEGRYNTPSLTCSAPPPSGGSLSVTSQDLSGNTLTGLYMQLYQGSTDLQNGWTPVTFSNLASGTYTVYANDYCNTSTHQNFAFNHWSDGTTNRGDAVTISGSNVARTAYYSVGSC